MKKLVVSLALVLMIVAIPLWIAQSSYGPLTVGIVDPVNDTSYRHIDIQQVYMSLEGNSLTFKLIPSGRIPQHPSIPHEKAIWYNFALDTDMNVNTGNYEHGIGMDYWVYVGWQWNISHAVAGVGRFENSQHNPGYKSLRTFSVSAHSITVMVPLSYIGNPNAMNWYAHTFDNTKGSTYTDSVPDQKYSFIILTRLE